MKYFFIIFDYWIFVVYIFIGVVCVIKFKLVINFCRDLNKDGILFLWFYVSWILLVNLILIMINSVDNIINKCCVICCYCFCVCGLFFLCIVVLVMCYVYLGGCLFEIYFLVLVMIIFVFSLWNFFYRFLDFRWYLMLVNFGEFLVKCFMGIMGELLFEFL